MSEWQTYEGDTSKIFYCAFHSIKNNIEIEKYLTNVVDYLNRFDKFKNDEDQVFNLIFKTSWKESEILNMAFANVSAASITLNRLLQNFQKINNDVIKELIIDLVCDIEFWMKKIDLNQDFSWFIMNTNCSGSHSYYYSVRSLLYGSEKEKFSTYDARFVTSTLLIRQAIEQRIKGILGINFIQDHTNRPVALSKIIDAFINLKNLKHRQGINIKRIAKINDWANHYLHRGIRPVPWQMEWAEFELGKMFFSGETTIKGSLSIYASFETENLTLLRDEFETIMKSKFGDVRIEWTNFGEVYERHKKL